MLAYKEFIYRVDLLSGFIFVQFAIDLYAADFARRFFVSLPENISRSVSQKFYHWPAASKNHPELFLNRGLYNLGRIKPILHCI